MSITICMSVKYERQIKLKVSGTLEFAMFDIDNFLISEEVETIYLCMLFSATFISVI